MATVYIKYVEALTSFLDVVRKLGEEVPVASLFDHNQNYVVRHHKSWCGVLVRRGRGCQLRCHPCHLNMVQNYMVRRPQSPRIAEQCDVNIHSLTQTSPKVPK
ncbi:hypothetical protein TNCV_4615471 [Trichonephila clavipes]|nr:hypothetical protein TNCV_4615471 [Trichonephila clavipes]